MKDTEALLGKNIAGRYLIKKVIGSGGQSTVYLAQQKNPKRMVALKCIRQELGENNESAIRFLREADDLAKLSHHNVVRVFESGRDEEIFFIAMEYLEGSNLNQIIKKSGPIEERKTLRYMVALSDALDHIHSCDLVHSDVKSSNIIIVRKDERPVLMDLGIAIQVQETVREEVVVVGTPEFMSPEQSRGDALDERTDLYSLGIVMYHSLTGQVPFQGSNFGRTKNMVLNDEPIPPKQKNPKISNFSNELIMGLLSKDPSERIDSAKKLADILRKHLERPADRNTSGKSNKGKSVSKKKVSPEKEARIEPKPEKRRRKAPEGEAIQNQKRPRRTGKRKGIKWLIGISAFLFMAILVLAGMWISGLLPISNQVIEGEVIHLSPGELEYYIESAEENVNEGNYVLALRAYQVIKDRSSSFETVRNQYLRTKMELVAQLTQDINFIQVPGGNYILGKDDSKADYSPEHMIYLDSYRISANEVSLPVFIDFLNAMNCDPDGYVQDTRLFLPGHKGFSGSGSILRFENGLFRFDGPDNLPAFGVTWDGARLFAEFIGCRLPSESEWESAARNPASAQFSGGDNAGDVAWYQENSSSLPSPSGMLRANDLGIYDMSGNVWEWCADPYTFSYKTTDLQPRKNILNEDLTKVIRGGDIQSGFNLVECTYRSYMTRNSLTNDFIGFRLCK